MHVNRRLEALGFAIGDMVIMNGEDPNGVIRVGEVGTVCDYHRYGDGCDIGVEWEIERNENHSCAGHSKPQHGRYVPHESIAHVNVDIGEIEPSEFCLDMLFDTTS